MSDVSPLMFYHVAVEMLGPLLPGALALGLVWLVLVALAFARRGAASGSLWPRRVSLIVGAVAGAAAMILVLPFTHSEFRDLAAPVDYFLWGGIGVGVLVGTAILLYPVLSLLCGFAGSRGHGAAPMRGGRSKLAKGAS